MPKRFSDKDISRFMDGGLRDPIGDAIEYAKDAGLSPEESARHILDAIERQYWAEDQPSPFSDPYMDLDDIYMDRGDIYMDPPEVGPWLGKKGIGNRDPTRLSNDDIFWRFLEFPQELHKATELWRQTEDLPYGRRQFEFEMPESDSPVLPLPSAETKKAFGWRPKEPKRGLSRMTIGSSDPKWPGPRGWTPDPLRKGYFHFKMKNDVSRPKPLAKAKNKMPNWAAWRELLKEDQLSGADIKRVDKMLSAHEKENWQRRSHDLGLHGLVRTPKAGR